MMRVLRAALTAVTLAAVLMLGAGSAMAQEETPVNERSISLVAAPSRVLADESRQNVVYVQLREGTRARLASTDITIGLTSTNPFVAKVPSAVVIPAGSSYVRAALTTTDISGDVTLTAWLNGQAVAQTDVVTVKPAVLASPYYLELHPGPGHMISGAEPAGILSVVLVDAVGRLVPAPRTIRAVLRSSEPHIVAVRDEVVIPRGETGATSFVEPLAEGTAVLSAVAPGFSSRFASVEVYPPGGEPRSLSLQAVPPVNALRTGPLAGVVVQALDGDGKPTYFPCAVVSLVSSLPQSVDVESLAASACGQNLQYVTGTITTNERPDIATITATASGLRPTAIEVTTQGHLPAELRVSAPFQTTLAAEEVPGFVVVQVIDAEGTPVTSHIGIDFSIAGSKGALPSVGRIPAGESFVALPLDGPRGDEAIEVWIATPDLGAAATSTLADRLPVEISIRYIGAHLMPGEEADVLVTVTSAGEPVAGAVLDWTAVNGTLRDAPGVTDEFGNARAVFIAQTPGDGAVVVLAASPGYGDVLAQTAIPVVDPAAMNGPPGTTFLGIPVILLLAATLIVLAVYIANVVWPALRTTAVWRPRTG